MKNLRNYLLFLSLIATISAFPQAMQRNVVILEIGTGTWCTWCPGAATGADQLVEEGKAVAVIENHNDDPYSNTYSDARNNYYGIDAFPTSKFDGIVTHEGGAQCPSGNIYSTFLPLYEQRHATPSPVNICFTGSHTGDAYTVTISVDKLTSITATDLRLHLVVTESNIPVSWMGCMTDVDFVNRLMIPSASGTTFSLDANDNFTTTLNFNADPSWVTSNCELVAFVQNNSTREIYNGVKSPLNSLPSSLFALNDFTGNPTSGCIPFQVNFTTIQPPSSTLTWSLPGGSPATSTVSNPTVNYSQTGTYDVILSGTNGVCLDQISKGGYITAMGVAGTPGTIAGNTNLCLNPFSNTYTISAVSGADSYTWEIEPSNAGVIFPSGTSCTVNWEDTFLGTAHIKVQAVNSFCGPGNWSPILNITISDYPGQCTLPAGSSTICQDGPDNTYSTTVSTPATSYFWNLDPPTAGYTTQGGLTTAVDWDSNFSGTATLMVKAINGLCEGAFSAPLTITLNSLPTAYNVTGGGAYCGAGGNGSDVGLDGSQLEVDYSLYLDNVLIGSAVSGTGSSISFGNQLSAGSYTVMAESTGNGCSRSMVGSVSISIDPQAPQEPSDPNGPSMVFTGSTATTDFSTEGGNYASTYSWEISPNEAGSISGASTTATVSWNLQFVGVAKIKVQGVNSCGGGTFSNEFPVEVAMNVGVPDASSGKEFNISPNPANDFLNIFGPVNTQAEIIILNSIGSTVMHQEVELQNGNKRINIQKLTPGIYFIRIDSKNSSQVSRLIVK